MYQTRKNETPESPFTRPTNFDFLPDGRVVEVPMSDNDLLGREFRAGARAELAKTITNWPNKPLTYPNKSTEIPV